MQPVQDTIGNAKASPTKDFFVRMLTRDIELHDALLDLLDNCVDGIVRTIESDPANPQPYSGFKASFTLTPEHFQIEDNCGGIPISVASDYAFSMGRPPGDPQKANGATVGMYGIGMKRAIFKIGTEALVESRSDTGFKVEFTEQWMNNESWNDLPMHPLANAELPEGGTRIKVTKLHQEVAAAFSDATWVDEFRKAIARHYSIIISKGFSVSVHSGEDDVGAHAAINGEPFKLIQSGKIGEENKIAPYVYTGKIGDVQIEIFAGLYRQLLDEEEGAEEEETTGTSDDAGWTVACNDRVVIWKDKSRLTGWGEATVPNYHGQFIAITGMVLLTCADPTQLPFTTTKRGIDAASNVYSEVKDLMREATKDLTSFTNKWKKFPQKLDEIYRSTTYVELEELRSMTAVLPMRASRKNDEIKKYEPTYPVPEQESTSARVSFVALKADVIALAKFFFDEPKTRPGIVGEAAFRNALENVRGDKA